MSVVQSVSCVQTRGYGAARDCLSTKMKADEFNGVAENKLPTWKSGVLTTLFIQESPCSTSSSLSCFSSIYRYLHFYGLITSATLTNLQRAEQTRSDVWLHHAVTQRPRRSDCRVEDHQQDEMLRLNLSTQPSR